MQLGQARIGTWGLLLLLASAGCEKSEECQKARLAAATSWEDVKKQAAKLKYQGTPGFESLSTEQKAEHHKVFQQVEDHAGLLFESFAFEKITWNAAKNGRDKLESAWNGYRDKDKYSSFNTQLQGAYKKYDAVEAACR